MKTLAMLLALFAIGCLAPHADVPLAETEPASLPTGRLSPDRQWLLTQEQTTNPPGRRLLVAPAAAGQSLTVLSGLPGPRYQTLWSAPPAPPLLVITDPHLHRGSKCFAYDPVANRLWRIDEEANRDMDRSVPEPLNKRQTRARAISPDGAQTLLDISGSIRNAPFYKVYAVETGTGKILRTFRHEYLVPEQWWRDRAAEERKRDEPFPR